MLATRPISAIVPDRWGQWGGENDNPCSYRWKKDGNIKKKKVKRPPRSRHYHAVAVLIAVSLSGWGIVQFVKPSTSTSRVSATALHSCWSIPYLSVHGVLRARIAKPLVVSPCYHKVGRVGYLNLQYAQCKNVLCI